MDLKCYKSFITLLKLLKNRKYIVNDDMLNITYNDFCQKYKEKSDLTMVFFDNNQNSIFIFYPNDEKVGVKQLRLYLDIMVNENIKNAILIVKECVTGFAKQELNSDISEYRIEDFTESEMQYDITEHQLQPKFEVLTPYQKNILLKKYNITDDNLPIIIQTDPIARYYGLSIGDILKITRKSETAGKCNTFRICK